MLTIGTKQKRLLFEVSTKGIQNSELEFWLRIFTEDCSLGFKGELVEGGKLLVKVPPIEGFLTKFDPSTTYKAQIEIIGEGKYFWKTWEGEVKLEKTPQVNLKLEGVTEEVETSKSILKEESDCLDDDSEKDLEKEISGVDEDLVEQGILSEQKDNLEKPLFEFGRTLGPQALLKSVLETSGKK